MAPGLEAQGSGLRAKGKKKKVKGSGLRAQTSPAESANWRRRLGKGQKAEDSLHSIEETFC